MKNRTFFSLLWCLFILSGCFVPTQEFVKSTPTKELKPSATNIIYPVEVISPTPGVNSTKDSPQSKTYEITVSIQDVAKDDHIYNLVIGCLETTLCVLSSKELLNMPSLIWGLNWSPDGQLLAFSGMEGDKFDIFVVSNDGEIIDNITKTKETDEDSPNWSPDGTQLAYSVTSSMEASKILVSSPSGTNIEQILKDVFEPIQFTWSNRGMTAFSAFVSTHDGRYQIRILNKDGSPYWITPLDENKMGFGSSDASFSPDGNLLLYTASWLNNDRIYLADLETKSTQDLFPTDKTCSEFKPSWSPDGQWFAFFSNCESDNSHQYQIYLVRLDKKQKIKLDIGLKGNIRDVVWRPNNK